MSSTISPPSVQPSILSPRLSVLVTETAGRLSTRNDLDALAQFGTARVALGMTIHYSHDVPALRAAEREAWRVYTLYERFAEAAIRRERPHTAVNTQKALDRANRHWPAARDAGLALNEAEKASTADRKTVFALLAGLPDGCTWRTLLTALRAAADGGSRYA